jgi:hypothetical protein
LAAWHYAWLNMGVVGAWWLPRSSKPVAGRRTSGGGFDSHPSPLRNTLPRLFGPKVGVLCSHGGEYALRSVGALHGVSSLRPVYHDHSHWADKYPPFSAILEYATILCSREPEPGVTFERR